MKSSAIDAMGRFEHTTSDDALRRDELVHTIEHSLQSLSLAELEALYYDMLTKDYIRQ